WLMSTLAGVATVGARPPAAASAAGAAASKTPVTIATTIIGNRKRHIAVLPLPPYEALLAHLTLPVWHSAGRGLRPWAWVGGLGDARMVRDLTTGQNGLSHQGGWDGGYDGSSHRRPGPVRPAVVRAGPRG